VTVPPDIAAGADLSPEVLGEWLPEILRPHLGAVEATGITRLKGGYSREMWSFDARDGAGRDLPLILCADSPAGVVDADTQALDRVREAALLATLHGQGLPVPNAVTAAGPSGPLGRAFLVMDRRPGTAAIGAFRRDPSYLDHRATLAAELAGILAAIHRADVDTDVLGPRPRPAEVGPLEVARWSDQLRAMPDARSPALDRALDWLVRERPRPPDRVVLVHGDYRIGNILHGPDGAGVPGLRTVLDWEMAHFGDALEDVAWAQLVCWRFGTGRVGGLVPPSHWADLYGRAAGTDLDRRSLRFWEVLGTVKMACVLWRAAAAASEPAERGLLRQLFADLSTELDDHLLPDG
jgi:aminoglycoside phosphotransferase (APT) family kinase protein